MVVKLDTAYPYGNTYMADGTTPPITDFTSADTPRDGLTGTPPPNHNSTPRTQIEVHESFETYLMFKPPGSYSLYVPLRKATWKWGGVVSSADNWVAVTGAESSASDTSGAEYYEHPKWTDNISSDIEAVGP